MARRRKSSPLEDGLDILARLPWWVCVVLAAVSYVALHRLAAPIPASDMQGHGGAMVAALMQKALVRNLALAGQYILPLLCLVAAAVSAWRRKRRHSLVSDVAQARSADALDGMDWREFEVLVGEAYRLQGYRVTETGGGGADGGVDLVLAKGGEKFLVQCKQWKAYKVGVDVVRALYGVMAAQGATGGFVVTSGRFTADARDFAQGRNIELIDGPRLFAMIQKARQAAPQPAVPRREPMGAPEPHRVPPACPRCGSAMQLRTARRGAHVGNTFWGCATYPDCRGTRACE